MTLLEKFYEWWDNADFEDIIMVTFLATMTALVTMLITGLILAVKAGGAQ